MTTYDVHVEFVNGQETWCTVSAADESSAEQAVSDRYDDQSIGSNVWNVAAHPWGTRPGFKRQPRHVT